MFQFLKPPLYCLCSKQRSPVFPTSTSTNQNAFTATGCEHASMIHPNPQHEYEHPKIVAYPHNMNNRYASYSGSLSLYLHHINSALRFFFQERLQTRSNISTAKVSACGHHESRFLTLLPGNQRIRCIYFRFSISIGSPMHLFPTPSTR
jgi:hypothetical protein